MAENDARQKDETLEKIKAEKARLKLEKKTARKGKGLSKKARIFLFVVIGCVVITAILCAILIPIALSADSKEQAPDSPVFSRPNDQPELSAEGIKGAIQKAYYTNDGHLAVHLRLSNGLNSPQRMTYLQVSLTNDQGEVVAEGETDQIPESFSIGPMSLTNFILYISPEDVHIPDDDLDTLTYQINTRGLVDDPSVLSSATSQPAS